MAAIEIENLGFTYPSREVPTLRDITTRVPSGAFVLLTGPTGCGKSTLLRTLNGLIPHASAGTLTGTVRLNGKDIAAQPLATTCQQVALLFQNPNDQLFCTRVEDEIAFGLENLGFPPEEIKERIALALKQVGLRDFASREISSLSGGQKQRVALAAICAMQPQVLLLDEPTSHLDPRGAHDILTIVTQLNKELGITVILATHRTKEVAPLCDRVWLMNEGRFYLDLPEAGGVSGSHSISAFRCAGAENRGTFSRRAFIEPLRCIPKRYLRNNTSDISTQHPRTPIQLSEHRCGCGALNLM